MSKKTTSTGNNQTSFQFQPDSMKAYQENLGSWMPFARSLFQNPFGNDMFKQENTIGQDQAARMGQRNISNIMGNANAMGYGTNGGLMNEMLANAGRATSGMQANAFRSAVGNANQRAMQGLGMTASFQPLMTGSNSNFNQTQQTSGLGTWLPQVIGMGAGAAMNAFMPGMSESSGGSGSGAASGVGTSGMGMNSIGSGMGSIFGAPKGYGYGGTTSGGWTNPFMFGGR